MIPRPYQIVGRDFLAARRFALLADEMRVGKTPQAILAADKIKAARVLVVAPAIAGEHWRREWARWSPARPPAEVATAKTDLSAPGPRVLVVSYDRAARAVDPLSARRWNVLILDECHYARNITAARTHAIYGKNGLGWAADRIWALSGTPTPRHAGELYPTLRAFGVTPYRYEQFVRRYCWFKPNGMIGGTKASMIGELQKLLSQIMLRRTRAEVAPEMPAVSFSPLEIDVSPAAIDAPEELKSALAEDTLPARMSDTLAGWRAECALAKAPAVADEVKFALESGQIDRTVVFAHHIAALETVAERLRRAGYQTALITGGTGAAERARIVDRFGHEELDVVCANIIAAGTAVDLSAARHGYFLEMDWVPGNNAQAASRLVSLARHEPVTFDVATWPGSVDEAVQAILSRRTRELSALWGSAA